MKSYDEFISSWSDIEYAVVNLRDEIEYALERKRNNFDIHEIEQLEEIFSSLEDMYYDM